MHIQSTIYLQGGSYGEPEVVYDGAEVVYTGLDANTKYYFAVLVSVPVLDAKMDRLLTAKLRRKLKMCTQMFA
jgi:hypothetical protein